MLVKDNMVLIADQMSYQEQMAHSLERLAGGSLASLISLLDSVAQATSLKKEEKRQFSEALGQAKQAVQQELSLLRSRG